MNLSLPPVSPFRMVSTHANGWSDNYGAIRVAADYAGLSLPPQYFIRGIWHHGCYGPWEAYTPAMLACNAPAAEKRPVLTARQEEADYLQANGFRQAKAIGLPILYTKPSGLPRRSRSLLVMPVHTLIGNQFPDRSVFRAYAKEIAAAATGFAETVVCVHPNCQKNNLWVDEFKAEGLTVIFGAQTNDANALARMRALFEQFETVTTNGWGSHIAYALAFGAKVSIYGSCPRQTEENLLQDTTWAVDPVSLKVALAAETEQKERAFLKEFSVPPAQAVANPKLGDWLVGTAQKLSPDQMRLMLDDLLDSPLATASAWQEKKMSRILFVSPEATRTGAPMFLLYLLRWLRHETKINFEILLGAGGPLEEAFRQVGLVHFKKDFENDSSAMARFDLIYANTCLNGELLDDLPCGDIPVITHVHELDTAYDQLGARRLAACLRQTAWVLAGSEAVAVCLEKRFGWERDRMSVCPKAVDTAVCEKHPPADWAAGRRQYGIPQDAHVIVGCGPQHIRKGTDLFLQLAQQVKTRLGAARPVRFLWIGAEAKPELAGLLKTDIKRMGLQAEVALLGELADPRPVFELADVICLPSREDACPLVMLEAAAMGKPLLGFEAAGGLTDFARHGGGITVPHLDVPALAVACVALLGDDIRRAEMGGAARLFVEEHFASSVRGPEILGRMEALWNEFREPKLKKSWAEIYARWCLEEAPHRPYVLAHLARCRARRDAAGLIKAGRLKEAMGILVRALNADLATNSPLVICESLCDIGQDIAPLDAKQAAVLFERAAHVARGAQLPIERFRPKECAPNFTPGKSLASTV
jgi:glycosyltransferase involved in cell wall biosynthesis